MSEDSGDKNIFRKLFGKKESEHPAKSAKEMASEFQEDIQGRLDNIVNEQDREFVKYSVQPYRTEESDDAGVSVRIYVKVDKLKQPLNTTQQIHNVVWAAENMHKPQPEIRTLGDDTIEEYYQSGGRIKDVDGSGNLTTQKNYKFLGN